MRERPDGKTNPIDEKLPIRLANYGSVGLLLKVRGSRPRRELRFYPSLGIRNANHGFTRRNCDSPRQFILETGSTFVDATFHVLREFIHPRKLTLERLQQSCSARESGCKRSQHEASAADRNAESYLLRSAAGGGGR